MLIFMFDSYGWRSHYHSFFYKLMHVVCSSRTAADMFFFSIKLHLFLFLLGFLKFACGEVSLVIFVTLLIFSSPIENTS
jgi:hypothetical protein